MANKIVTHSKWAENLLFQIEQAAAKIEAEEKREASSYVETVFARLFYGR